LFPFGSDLDENLQNTFLKYLEIRGIKPGVTNVLFDYMANKDTKEYLLWLKNVKNFVEK
jgi:complement component 1 Q subcomponent-binding protein